MFRDDFYYRLCSDVITVPSLRQRITKDPRELEQAVRRILLIRRYAGDHKAVAPDLRSQLVAGIEHGTLDADKVLSVYCRLVYERHGTYEEVARRTKLDRRTVKAYLKKRTAVPGPV